MRFSHLKANLVACFSPVAGILLIGTWVHAYAYDLLETFQSRCRDSVN